jgi:cyanophycinase
MKKIATILSIILAACIIISCHTQPNANGEKPLGKLYIIGGGKRSPEMVQQLIDISGVDSGKYIVVLAFASEDVDTAAYWAMKQFKDKGVESITSFYFKKGEPIDSNKIDSLVNAGMIYISGGDQSRFMDIVRGTPIAEAIHKAYQRGGVIAGTSAGAAVQSKKMITGNQLRHPEMKGYKTIEPNNIEISEGLGLVTTAIFDQHFIWRERMNRLISVSIENPAELAIGIDESTAILVEGTKATVYGISQVLVLNASRAAVSLSDSLLGAENIKMSLYLPGQSFSLIP